MVQLDGNLFGTKGEAASIPHRYMWSMQVTLTLTHLLCDAETDWLCEKSTFSMKTIMFTSRLERLPLHGKGSLR